MHTEFFAHIINKTPSAISQEIKRIDTRPDIVDKKERIGDWEGDTIIGSDKTKRLITSVERKSGYGIIEKIDIVSAINMHKILQRSFKRISKSKRYTFTYDNGTELGKEDSDLEKKIHMDVYRAHPYHSWERGCNENFNGLVRTFFPKKTDFGMVSIENVKHVQYLLNHRPRKRLGYLTPHEVFFGIIPSKLFD
ncbi:MAG: hypothetical protein CR972_03245 [Candidatus Moraniibacteriota bacterium]|nr:MAG: hypothetical protein CR972_03245 [Candidatus Moranbacteria bacterium]